MRGYLVPWLLCAACGRLSFDAHDAAIDGEEPLGAWTQPVRVFIESHALDDPSVTSDELEMYVNGAPGSVYVSTRATIDAAWGPLALVTELSIPAVSQPAVTGDGLYITLGIGSTMYLSTRGDRLSSWGAPSVDGELTAAGASDAAIRDDLREAVITVISGVEDLALVRRTGPGSPWGPPQPIAMANTSDIEAEATIGGGGLMLVFGSTRVGSRDLYLSTRASLDDPFGMPDPIAELNSVDEDSDPWMSADGRTIYFTSSRSGERQIWMSRR